MVGVSSGLSSISGMEARPELAPYPVGARTSQASHTCEVALRGLRCFHVLRSHFLHELLQLLIPPEPRCLQRGELII